MYKITLTCVLLLPILTGIAWHLDAHGQSLDITGFAEGSCTVTIPPEKRTWPLTNFAGNVAQGKEFNSLDAGTVECTAENVRINISSFKGGLTNGPGPCGAASATCVHYMATAEAIWTGTGSIGAVVLAQGNGATGEPLGSISAPTATGDIKLRLFPILNQSLLQAGQFSDTLYIQVGSDI